MSRTRFDGDPDLPRQGSGVANGRLGGAAVIGLTRGFGGLNALERLALGVVLAMTAMLGTALFGEDVDSVAFSAPSSGPSLPPAHAAAARRRPHHRAGL